MVTSGGAAISLMPTILGQWGRMSIQGFEQWLQSPAGRYVLDWEHAVHDALVVDIFGFNAVQLSLPDHDFLRTNRMPLRLRCDDGRSDGRIDTLADLHHLPFANASIDLVVMPHTLEFDDNPHQVLREVERVLVPEGQLIVTGFNPYSLWGARRRVTRPPASAPWRGSYISLPRLREWLSLLGFEVQAGQFGCYAPAFEQEKWLRRFAWMDRYGPRFWPPAGAVYSAQAIKRQHGLRLITPQWHDRKAKAKALVTVTQRTDQ
jgi:SAM-dependent methyltransferase